jgi:hypothetical protein
MNEAVDSANGLLLTGFAKGINRCIADTNLLANHAAALDIGAGSEWQGLPGKIKEFSEAAEVVWLGGRYPVSSILRAKQQSETASDPSSEDELDYLLVGGSIRASWNELSATGNTTTPQIRANSVQAWTGLERATSGSSFAAQIGYTDESAVSSAQSQFSKSGMRWLASGSLKLGDTLDGFVGSLLSDFGDSQSLTNGVWLNVSYGTANGTSTTLKDRTVLVSLSFSQTPGDTFDDSGSGSSGG